MLRRGLGTVYFAHCRKSITLSCCSYQYFVTFSLDSLNLLMAFALYPSAAASCFTEQLSSGNAGNTSSSSSSSSLSTKAAVIPDSTMDKLVAVEHNQAALLEKSSPAASDGSSALAAPSRSKSDQINSTNVDRTATAAQIFSSFAYPQGYTASNNFTSYNPVPTGFSANYGQTNSQVDYLNRLKSKAEQLAVDIENGQSVFDPILTGSKHTAPGCNGGLNKNARHHPPQKSAKLEQPSPKSKQKNFDFLDIFVLTLFCKST